jgi:hypothetical protein
VIERPSAARYNDQKRNQAWKNLLFVNIYGWKERARLDSIPSGTGRDSMDITPFILVIGLTLLVAAVLSFSTIKRILMIRRTPTTWINALPTAGQVEVSGQVGKAVTYSPIANTKCVLWQVEVEEERTSRSGKNQRTSWHTVCKKSSMDRFDVSDETGTVKIDPDGAELILHKDFYEASGLFQTLDPQTVEGLENLGVNASSFLGINRTLRVSERSISPGEKIYVLGGVQSTDEGKVITAAKGSSFVIGDRSEEEVLKELYFNAALRGFGPLVVGGAIILFGIFYGR